MDELNLEKAYSIGEYDSENDDDSDDENYDVLPRLLQADVLPRGAVQAVWALLAGGLLDTCYLDPGAVSAVPLWRVWTYSEWWALNGPPGLQYILRWQRSAKLPKYHIHVWPVISFFCDAHNIMIFEKIYL